MENEELQHRPLGVVKEVLEKLGAEVSYAYEDLVFVKHNHFILQFGDSAQKIFFFKNIEIDQADSEQQYSLFTSSAESMGLKVHHGGEYSLKENDEGTISIEFH